MSDDDDPSQLRPKHRTALETIDPVAVGAGVELIPLVTNLRRLGPLRGDTTDWMERAHGSFYAAIAHALSPMVARMLLASSFDYPNVVPWGSHPMLDPLLGSADVIVDHHNAHLSRYQKVLGILELGGLDAVASLIVCFGAQGRASGAPPNCGRCEKCVRTLTELTAAGVDVERLETFEERTVSVATIRSIGRFVDSYQFDCWRDLIGPLRSAGRDDLSRAVAAKVRSNMVFEFDRTRLAGAVWRTKRALRHPSKAFRGTRRRLTRAKGVRVRAGSGVADG
jgi:hypothetical protein